MWLKHLDRRSSSAVVLVGLLLIVTARFSAAPVGSQPLPPRLEQYVSTTVNLTADQRQRLSSGEPVTKLLDADASKEVAVFGAIWINAPMRRYVEAIRDIERFERGGAFTVTKRISAPPQPADFAALQLPAKDIKDMRWCRVGDCILKLGEDAVRRFETEIDWQSANSRAAADAVMRDLALQYVSGYLEGGNERLAVYRDKSRPTFVAREFEGLIDQIPALTGYMPNMRSYLVEFPKLAPPEISSFLYWQETNFGLRPTIRISHVAIHEGAHDTVVASKMLYASHYFWTGLELRVLLPDPARGHGFWFVTLNRSRLDGLSGFTGMFVRRRVRSGVEAGTVTVLRSTKQRLEQ